MTWLAIVGLAGGFALGQRAAIGQPGTRVASAVASEQNSSVGEQQMRTLDRTVLPIAEPRLAPIAELDARNAKAPRRFEIKMPAKAPNVLIVLIDDIGIGQPSAFGGP